MMHSLFQRVSCPDGLAGPGRRKPARRSTALRRSFLPCLEVLDDRTLPSTFMVTNLLDGGDGSLRQAILGANSTYEDNDVVLAVTGTISLATPLPDLDTNMSVHGPGADSLTVQRSTAEGTPDFSVFTVSNGAIVNLSGLTIANGSALYGGGIFNDGGTLDVSDSVLTGNSAWRGGGITNFGSLTVNNSTLAGNRAASKGGGIANFGPLAVSFSTLTGNSASTGGAIYNFDGAVLAVSYSTVAGNSADFGGGLAITGGVVTVTNTTLAANSAGVGGGVLNFFSGMLSIGNCTLAGNSATYQGGGIRNEDGAALAVSNSTVSGNSAAEGGGISNEGTVTSRNTILAGNTAAAGPDLSGTCDSQGHNLIGDTSGCSGFDPSDLLNVDPMLGPLQDNGGPTWTMALLPGSPAIDAGDNTDAPDWDQRGDDFLRIVNGVIDIGAFEVQVGDASRPSRTTPSRLDLIVSQDTVLLLSVTGPSTTLNTPSYGTASAFEAYGHKEVIVLDMPGGRHDERGGPYIATPAARTAKSEKITSGVADADALPEEDFSQDGLNMASARLGY